MGTKTIEIITCDHCGAEIRGSGALLAKGTRVIRNGAMEGPTQADRVCCDACLPRQFPQIGRVDDSEVKRLREEARRLAAEVDRLRSEASRRDSRGGYEDPGPSWSFGNSGGGGASGRPLPGPSGLIVAPLRRGASW